MISNSAIPLALRFYRSEQASKKMGFVLLVVGISGILETLPILVSLPLIKAIFDGSDLVRFQGIKIDLLLYFAALLGLLILRFVLGYYSQFLNASLRIELLTQYRRNTPSDQRKAGRLQFGKRVQALNFLWVGWSQFLPGMIFSLLGILLSPVFGGITCGILIVWMMVLSRVKIKQDAWHAATNQAQINLDTPDEHLDKWNDSKLKSASWDAINKNLREFIVISTLIIALLVSSKFGAIKGTDSIFMVILMLRGLQQLFTGYIMSQQLSGLKIYFKNDK